MSRLLKIVMISAAAVLFVLITACKADPFYEPTEAPESEEIASQQEETEVSSESGSGQEESNSSSEDDSDASESSFDIYDGVSEDEVITTASGLQYIVYSEGDGQRPESGQLVRVHYTGQLDDGTVFDSSLDRGTPFAFPLGQGRVIAGWDEGIALLTEGSRARLIIPSNLGYGPNGSGIIPPDATLVFDVELIEILPGSPESPMEVADSQYTETESGLKYYDIELGQGAPAAEGQLVFMHFTAWLEDGTKLGSTIDSGQPIPYVVGSGELFPGFDEGLEAMQIGSVRQLVFPPELAYGEGGTPGGQIPPNATLIFEVEVTDIE